MAPTKVVAAEKEIGRVNRSKKPTTMKSVAENIFGSKFGVSQVPSKTTAVSKTTPKTKAKVIVEGVEKSTKKKAEVDYPFIRKTEANKLQKKNVNALVGEKLNNENIKEKNGRKVKILKQTEDAEGSRKRLAVNTKTRSVEYQEEEGSIMVSQIHVLIFRKNNEVLREKLKRQNNFDITEPLDEDSPDIDQEEDYIWDYALVTVKTIGELYIDIQKIKISEESLVLDELQNEKDINGITVSHDSDVLKELNQYIELQNSMKSEDSIDFNDIINSMEIILQEMKDSLKLNQSHKSKGLQTADKGSELPLGETHPPQSMRLSIQFQNLDKIIKVHKFEDSIDFNDSKQSEVGIQVLINNIAILLQSIGYEPCDVFA